MRWRAYGAKAIAAVLLDRRPIGTDGQRLGSELRKIAGRVHHLAVYDRHERLDSLDLLFGNCEVVGRQRGEVCQLADFDGPLLVLLAGEPRAADGVAPQGFRPVEPVRLRVERRATHRLAANEPVQGYPWVVAGDARAVRTCADRDLHLQHPTDRRRVLGRLFAIAVDKVLALKSHSVLNGDAAAKRLDALDAFLRDGLGVIEKPTQAVE